MSWFENCYRQGFKNLGQGEGLARYDASKLAAYWKQAGAELVYMDAIAQRYTLFPTGKSEISPYLHGRDLVGEFTDACRKLGIRAGAYITPFEHIPFTKGHPEWCQTLTDGSLFLGAWHCGCWNSPYLDAICALISELFSRYALDAAFFDGLLSRHGVCHCPSCKAKFKAATGFDLPSAHDMADPAFRAYLRWKQQTLAEACRRIVAATRVKNLDVQVISNSPVAWCNWCAVQPEEFFDATEFACTENIGLAEKGAGYLHMPSVLRSGYMIAYTRGQSRGFPKVQAYSYVSSVSVRIDLDILLEAKSVIALGGLPCIHGDQPQTKVAFDYVRRCEPYLADTKPVLWAAVAASQESCDTQRIQEAVHGAYFEDLRGVYMALSDLKTPPEFVSGRDLGELPLDPYAVLILSDVGRINARQAERIRNFVSGGGGLIATCETGLFGEDGRKTADFALADVMGVNAAAMPEELSGPKDPWFQTAAYLRFEGKPWWGDAIQPSTDLEAGAAEAADLPWETSFKACLLHDPFQPVAARQGAKVIAWIEALKAGRQQKIPGIVENRYGKGRAIYLSPRFGEIYARFPFLPWRRLLAEALDRVASRPAPVTVKAPLCVSIHTWEQPAQNRWVIHLLNDLDETGRPHGRMVFAPNDVAGSFPRTRTMSVRNVDVIIRKPGASRAELPLEGVELPVRKVKDGIKVRIRTLDQHAMIVVS